MYVLSHNNVFYSAGYSFGGIVAYEIASELRRKNETVAMVFMVDTYAWFSKGLTNCSEYITKYIELNVKKMQTSVVTIVAFFYLRSPVRFHFSSRVNDERLPEIANVKAFCLLFDYYYSHAFVRVLAGDWQILSPYW